MGSEIKDRAQKVVESFKKDLGTNMQTAIGEAEFERLAGLIDGALEDDRREMVFKVEELIKTLRKEIEIPELGM